MRPQDPDKPWVDWGDVYATHDGGCVVRAPHDADRLEVGMKISKTESGSEGDPGFGDITEVRKTHGRLLTLRDQWDYYQVARVGNEPSPPFPEEPWYPDEGIPAWQECASDATGAEEIWVVVW